MTKIQPGTAQTVTYKAVSVEPNGTIRATYGSPIEFVDDAAAIGFLDSIRVRSWESLRGATATSRVVLVKVETQTVTSTLE